MKWTLPIPPSFLLEAVIQSHGWSQLEPFRRTDDGVSTAIEIPGRKLAAGVNVRQGPSALIVSTKSRLGKRQQSFVNERLRWMMGLDRDLSPFYAVAASEPKLRHVKKAGFGRLLRSPSMFEDVVKTILTTNTAWTGTIRMVSRLVERYGVSTEGDESWKAFPGPDRLAAAGVNKLRKDVGLGYRAPYVSELASSIASGAFNLEGLGQSTLPTDELRKELLSLKGVGPYAAATLLMLLGRSDFIPIDSWAFRLVSHEWHGGEPVGKKEVEEAFESWGKWKGLAYWFWDWQLLKEIRE